MGRIYCITGQSRELRENVVEALLEWSEKRGEISFSPVDPDGTYNLYLNDYLIDVDWDEYKQLTEQFDDDVLIPVYIGSDEGNSDLREFGIFKTYNVLFDESGFNQGINEILSSEFSYYKNDYSFREEEVIDETPVIEDGSEDMLPAPGKKQTIIKYKNIIISIIKAIIAFLKRRKKIELAGMAAVLCIIIGVSVTLSILDNLPDPFYSKDNFDLFTGYGDSTYVVNSNGDIYLFEGSSYCSLSKTIDKKNAILTTDYDELYYLTEGEARKITDYVNCSYISNKGNYIYYITRVENNYILSRYETKSGDMKELGSFMVSGEDGYYELSASPDGKILALSFNSDILSEQFVYDSNGGRMSLYDANSAAVSTIYTVTDKGDVYLSDTNGKFMVAKKSGDEYTFREISKESIGRVYFNKDHLEVLYTISESRYSEYDSEIYYDEVYYIYTEDKGSISLPVRSLVDRGGYWGGSHSDSSRIKAATSNVNLSAYVYDINTFRDMFFVSNNDTNYSICRLNKDYTAKNICESYGYLSQNGKYILCEINNKLSAVDKNGNVSVLLDTSRNPGTQFIGIADNKAVYYYDSNNNYLYYKKGGRVKKIYSRPQDGEYYNSEFITSHTIDSEKDILYFIENNRLYYSKSGGEPVEIKIDNNLAYNTRQTVNSNDSVIYYTTYDITTTDESEYDKPYIMNYKIYKITDSHELKFLFDYEIKQGGVKYD